MLFRTEFALTRYAERMKFHRNGLAQLYGRLAKHWALAEEPERAVIYLEKAADIASQQFSNEEVIPSRCF